MAEPKHPEKARKEEEQELSVPVSGSVSAVSRSPRALSLMRTPREGDAAVGLPGKKLLLCGPGTRATRPFTPNPAWALDPRAQPRSTYLHSRSWLVGPSIRTHGPDPNLPLLRVHTQAFLAAEPLPWRARQHLPARAALSRAPALRPAVVLLRGHQHAGHQHYCDCRAPANHTWC